MLEQSHKETFWRLETLKATNRSKCLILDKDAIEVERRTKTA
jgi:hypothetical protein